MDLGTRVFWALIALLLGASGYFTLSVVSDRPGVSGSATPREE